MGRLSGSPGPIRQTPNTPPPRGPKIEVIPPPVYPVKWCDQCGVSHDGAPISRATMQVDTPAGPLYLCGHHYSRHCFAFMELDYNVTVIYEVG